MEYNVVMTVRLPRILLALLVGAGLFISGAAFQGMFANPLVSADILGVAAGAGFGASIGILLFGNGYITQIFALIFGLAAIAFTYVIGGVGKNLPVYMLVLAGVVTSALFNALISLTKFVADPEEKLPSITYWLMGSLGTATYRDLWTAGPIILIGIILLMAVRWRINLLTLPEDEPESHLDVQKQVVILETLKRLAHDHNISCIINTHYPNHAFYLADQVLMIAKEKKPVIGPVHEIMTESRMKEYFNIELRKLIFNEEDLLFETMIPMALATKRDVADCKFNPEL